LKTISHRYFLLKFLTLINLLLNCCMVIVIRTIRLLYVIIALESSIFARLNAYTLIYVFRKIVFLKINQHWIPLRSFSVNQRYYTSAGLSLRFSSTCAGPEIVLYFELPENCGLLSISHNRWQEAQGRIQLDGTCSAFLGDKGTAVESSGRIIYQVS